MKTLIDEIKRDILQHPRVLNSALQKVDVWKRSHYTLLSQIINEEITQSEFLEGDRKFELGNSLSYITLQRIFENHFRETAVSDLRFLKTLHKLAIFLGYYDVNEYILRSTKLSIGSTSKDIKIYANIIEGLCKA